jgi:hypothetical protein
MRYPDELMIDWVNTPAGSTASIYWPQASAATVLHLASQLYASHRLAISDAHTIVCPVSRGVTYVPIPPGSGQNLAGLLAVDLPPMVVKGQEFNIVIRRITTRRVQQEPPIGIEFRTRPVQGGLRSAAVRAPGRQRNWRYVTGTFQVRIPVSTAEVILPAEANTLAIFKWRLQAMASTNRWYPVLERYVAMVSARVAGLGGDPDTIPPSLSGAPSTVETPGEHAIEYTGKVEEVIFDCFGAFEGFVLKTCSTSKPFKTRERAIGELALRACKEDLLLTVVVERGAEHRIERLIIRC